MYLGRVFGIVLKMRTSVTTWCTLQKIENDHVRGEKLKMLKFQYVTSNTAPGKPHTGKGAVLQQGRRLLSVLLQHCELSLDHTQRPGAVMCCYSSKIDVFPLFSLIMLKKLSYSENRGLQQH